MGDYDVLTSDQADMLRQFQEVTNIQDEQIALATLASLNWDLPRAIEAQLCNENDEIGPMEIDDSLVIERHDQNVRRTAIAELRNQSRNNSMETEAADPDFPFGRLLAGGSLEEPNSNQSSPHDNGSACSTRTVESLSSTQTHRIPVMTSSGAGSSSRITRSRARPTEESQHIVSPVAGARNFLIDGENSDSTDNDGNDDDDDDDVYHDAAPFGQLNEEDAKPSFNDDRVPLVPSDFTSIDEALHNFIAVFEARYGGNHPPFYSGSLQDALHEALEAPGRPVAERRPLAVLCSGLVSSLLKGQFVTWPWDITQKENRLKLFEWIDMLNVRDIRRTLEKFSDERFPLLVVIIKEKSVILPISVAWGCDGPQQVVNKLMEGLEEYQRIKSAEAAEERERIEREKIREEQAREYEQSLAQDRARQERLEREKNEQKAEEERRAKEEEDKTKRLQELAASLPVEPSADETNIAIVRVRFPDGNVLLRRFRMSEPLRNVTIFVESKGYSLDTHRIWTSDVPMKNVVETYDLNRSLAEIKWPVREQITVDEK
uniref:UBX domain-containing protein n=1 Tax=Setaria digitata TaxID=48799 RepID=A0A915Q173_9BILA